MIKLFCVKECCVCKKVKECCMCKKVKEVSRKIHSDECICREYCSFAKTELGKDVYND